MSALRSSGANPSSRRPQPDVGVGRHLRLQADEALDGVEHAGAGASEQALAGEERAVQRARAEDLGRQWLGGDRGRADGVQLVLQALDRSRA